MWGLTTERSTGRLLPALSCVRGIVVATKPPGSDEPIDLTTSLLQLTADLFPMANHSPLSRLLGRFPRSRCPFAHAEFCQPFWHGGVPAGRDHHEIRFQRAGAGLGRRMLTA